jgi:Zn-dependent metalloprotease
VTVYGDGSGVIFRELSGGLDVVAHENTHAVTQCTSDLVYRDESGALNESFSDMLGNSAEFFAAEPLSSNCVQAAGQTSCADWTIGEDVFLPADAVPGFRNMADPEEDSDSDDYSERLLGPPIGASCTPTAPSPTTPTTCW